MVSLAEKVVKAAFIYAGKEETHTEKINQILHEVSYVVSKHAAELIIIPDLGIGSDSAEFELIRSTAKKSHVHIVYQHTEKASEPEGKKESQYIIDQYGRIALERVSENGLVKGNKEVVTLEYSDGDFETGLLFAGEHLNPLLVQNNASQHEKIHIVFNTVQGEENQLDYLCSSYSQQAQTFTLCYSECPEKSKCFNPDASTKVGNPKGTFSTFVLYTKDITIQKHWIDPVGHYSRPDMLSLSVYTVPS